MIETKRPRRPLSWKFTIPSTFAKSESSLARPTFRPGFSGVPRCRTRIEPPETSWPAKRFTPRRWLLLSRPLRDEP